MQATFETAIKDQALYPLLDAIAELYGKAERSLFVDLHVRKRPLAEVKRE